MNNYKVTRLDTSNSKTFTNIVTEEQLNNIKISQGLYILLSYEPIQEEPTEPKEQTQTYKYYYRLHPPMPGGQPKNGLIETFSDEIIHNNQKYWG